MQDIDFAVELLGTGYQRREGFTTLSEAKAFVEENRPYEDTATLVMERRHSGHGYTSVGVAIWACLCWWEPTRD